MGWPTELSDASGGILGTSEVIWIATKVEVVFLLRWVHVFQGHQMLQKYWVEVAVAFGLED